MSTPTTNCQPKGTPTGGQFAEQPRTSPGLILEAPEDAPAGIEPRDLPKPMDPG